MAVPLIGWIALRHGLARFLAVLQLCRRRIGLWLLAGSIGFGVFYGCIRYSAGHAPGWIVAAT
jgi:hypothetical protein